MLPTFTTTPASSSDRRAGFSLLEMLIVLAIMGLSVALVLPRGEIMLDRVVAHAVFFDFQRQVADLRREAYGSQAPLVLYDNDLAARADPRGRVALLRGGWTYRLSLPVMIGEGGTCSSTDAIILNGQRKVMRLRADQGDCRFTRLE